MATGTAPVGIDIRVRRDALGITRQALANEATCSMSYLASIEAGVTVRHSAVMPRVVATLDRLEREAAEQEGATAA